MTSVVPEDLALEAAALAHAKAEADAQANGSNEDADTAQGLEDPSGDGANSSCVSICQSIGKLKLQVN